MAAGLDWKTTVHQYTTGLSMYVSSDLSTAKRWTDSKCVYCGAIGGQCGHLVMVLEGEDLVGGTLRPEVADLMDALCELAEAASGRDSLCGEGIVRDAMAYAMQHGGAGMPMNFVLGGGCSRDFLTEYVWDVLELAPNLQRVFEDEQQVDALEDDDLDDEDREVRYRPDDDDRVQYIWCDMPVTVRDLLRKHASELRGLAS